VLDPSPDELNDNRPEAPGNIVGRNVNPNLEAAVRATSAARAQAILISVTWR